MRKFCVLTTGRSGSTALMDRLETYDDIALPNKNVDCRDNELLLGRNIISIVSGYTLLLKRRICGEDGLIDGFFAHNRAAAYAGFKVLPDQMRRFDCFIERNDIQFITLVRRDVPSTVASFMLAMEQGTWRRSGGQPRPRWTLSRQNERLAAKNIRYLFNSHWALSQVEGAISLTYEDVCQAQFVDAALDDFFNRHIALENPQPPTEASGYVTNWESFKRFVEDQWNGLERERRSTGGLGHPQDRTA